MTKQITLVVSPKGESQFIYQEELDLSPLGTPVIKRASHVEPTRGLSAKAKEKLWLRVSAPSCTAEWWGDVLERTYPNSWWSDLTPSGGPVLGPFAKRSQALEAEANWLRRNILLKQKESQ